jgi:hypothetical protein
MTLLPGIRIGLKGDSMAFNVLNANPVTGYINTYGPSYKNVTDILSGRVLAAGGILTF